MNPEEYEKLLRDTKTYEVIPSYNADDVNPIETQDKSLYSDKDRYELARVAAGEGRNQGAKGMQLIMQTVKNRQASDKWPNTIMGVTRQPKQFSIFNEGDVNRPYVMSLGPESKDPQFLQAYELSEADLPEDLSKFKEADHYHTDKVQPSWSKSPELRKLGKHGAHIFYTTKPGTGQHPSNNLIPGTN